MDAAVNGGRGVGAARRAPGRPSTLLARRTVLGGVLASVLLAGCGGLDSPASPPAAADSVAPAEFAALVGSAATFGLNVHTPDEGSIPGTDAAIPFDQLRQRVGELPDRSTAIAVYCRTGRMSADAVTTLRDLGYTRLTELSGGMEAWRAEGRELEPGRDVP